jgi:hypothetical protein
LRMACVRVINNDDTTRAFNQYIFRENVLEIWCPAGWLSGPDGPETFGLATSHRPAP